MSFFPFKSNILLPTYLNLFRGHNVYLVSCCKASFQKIVEENKMLLCSSDRLLTFAATIFVLSLQCCALHIPRIERQASNESSSCLRPRPNDCSWYTKCLGARISCVEASPETYTPAWAESLCNSSIQNYGRLSSQGKQWADAGLTCSQEKLLPMFRQAPSCRIFSRKGAATQVSCFLNPNPPMPGLCDLPIEDLRVVKDIILNSLDLAVLGSLARQIQVPLSIECLEKLLQLV